MLRAPVKAFFRLLGYVPVRMRGERFHGDPFHVGFWNEVNRGRWESSTLDALQEFLGSESIFVDVGAWIGPTAMFAARRARRVYCLEPDPFAYECLLRNIARNELRNVTAFPLALAAKSGARLMTIPEGRMGNSRGTLLPSGSGAQVEVECSRWEEWRSRNGVGRVDFLKIDIEGGEFELLPSMRDYLAAEKPILHLSLHAPQLEPSEREKRLREIAEILRVYPALDADTLVEASRERFTSFLFLP